MLRKCAQSIRHDGVVNFWAKAATRLWETALVTNSANWYCAELSERPREVPETAGLEVDFCAMEEVLAWLQEIRTQFRWVWVDAELDAAREYGHVFPLVRSGQDRVGYIKVGWSRAYVTDFGRRITIPPRSAFVYDTFVHPRFRGKGIATFLIARTLGWLSQRDVRFLWCHIPTWNHASISAFAKCGFARVKHVRYARVLGCGLYTRRPEKLMQRAERACAQRRGGV